MKKKNKKDYSNKRFILVFIMMLCLIISMSTYWVYAYHHKYGKNYYEDKFISYKVSDYVTIEGNYVYLKNISDDISNNFIRSQKEIIKNNIIDMTVTKGIYKEILSIKISYILNADSSNYEEVLTLNIDLRNKKILNNDDILNKINVSYKEIATDIFNEYIKVSNNQKVIDIITDEEMTGNEFNNNSEKYIIRIREKLPEVMKVYIDKEHVYYLVRKNEITKVCYYTNTDINIGYINKEIGKI